MYEKVYKGVSLLAFRFFQALCREKGLHGTYDGIPEAERPGQGQTFTVSLSGRETYNVMQQVFEAANG